MGCAASKLENEETVRRSKERRRLMNDAVAARHHLAAALSDYLRSLRLTGSALSSFAAGVPLSVSDDTPPAVVLHCLPTRSTPIPPRVPPSVASPVSPRVRPPQATHVPPRVRTSPSITDPIPLITKISTGKHRPRTKAAPKLPHILSETSRSSSPKSEASDFALPRYRYSSAYSATASQASSIWNWENFYPPSPPDSEFFDQKAREKKQQQQNQRRSYNRSEYDAETERSEYEVFPREKRQIFEENDEETEREEVHCSDWGDHDTYRSTSSSDVDEDDEQRNESRSGAWNRSIVESPERKDYPNQQQQRQPSPAESVRAGYGKVAKSGGGPSYSESCRTGGEMSRMKMVVRHKDLKEIVDAIKEYFELAASAGDQASAMLEIGRAQLDRSFRQLKKTVYHSSSVLSNLSSSWTSKPPLVVKYKFDAADLDQPGDAKGLCSTLDRILAWEKKLYAEIKAREGVKIEHEKKLSALQSQERKGHDESKVDITKASITRLQSLIIVTSEAVSTTSNAIDRLRDSDLVPQLVELCHGFMYMWKSMHQYHEIQNNIVEQVRGLVNRSDNAESTSELHRQVTRDLESAVSFWHSSFCRLIKSQRDFICSLHGWFKLTLLPVTNENANPKTERSDVYVFFDEWKLALERVPDTVASESIKSFVNVVNVISAKQSEELKIKKQTESVSKELDKKANAIRSLERKYYQSYSMVGIGSGIDNGQALDARDPLSEKKSELAACRRRVEDELTRHSKAVEVTRAMTLNNLQTGLPGVFQALTGFSGMFSEALETVCSRSYAIR